MKSTKTVLNRISKQLEDSDTDACSSRRSFLDQANSFYLRNNYIKKENRKYLNEFQKKVNFFIYLISFKIN